MGNAGTDASNRIIGRYALHGVIASGGMANVHLGRLLGLAGFSRTVAVKRLHANFARDPEFVSMLIDEARLAARIRHPNVVAMLDVVALEGELLLVMEYVHGEALSKLIIAARKAKQRIPQHVLLTVMAGVLDGLHAAHEARNDRGEHIGLVHRDVSPQNIQVGVDGVAKVLDFGIAKAAGRLQDTRDDQLKGRLRYMAPEQLRPNGKVDRRSDIYSASVVLWEALTGKAIFKAESDWQMAHLIMDGVKRKPSELNPKVHPELDELVMRGLAVREEDRFQTAYDMAVAIEEVGPIGTPREVGQWVEEIAADALADRAARVDEVEGRSISIPPPPTMNVEEVRDSFSSVDSQDKVSPVARESGNPTPQSAAPDSRMVEDTDNGTAIDATLESRRSVEPRPKPYAVIGVATAFVLLAITAAAWALSPSPLRARAVLAGMSSGTIGTFIDRASAASTPAPSSPSPEASTAPSAASAKPDTPRSVPRPWKKPPAKNCNPPYYFDNDGVKHLKRECL